MPLSCSPRRQTPAFPRCQDKVVKARECRPADLFGIDPDPTNGITANHACQEDPSAGPTQTQQRTLVPIFEDVARPAMVPFSSAATRALEVCHQSLRRNVCQFSSKQSQGKPPRQERRGIRRVHETKGAPMFRLVEHLQFGSTGGQQLLYSPDCNPSYLRIVHISHCKDVQTSLRISRVRL